MLVRLRQAALLLLAAFVGFELGRGPFAEWLTDVVSWARVSWEAEKVFRGTSASTSLLISGFLLGQGLYLLARVALKKLGPMRATRSEKLAAWDPSLKLSSRFGLHLYLEHCSLWAQEDPTARTPSIALFKIHGLGRVNKARGTAFATMLLQRIADEVRAASIPDSVSSLRRWMTHLFPRPHIPSFIGAPIPRCPARWSGSTFALAFRELDAVQAVAIARELALWIRKETASFTDDDRVSISSAIVIGSPNVTARSLCDAATTAVASKAEAAIRVLSDPADVRAPVLAQMSDVAYEAITLETHLDDTQGSVAQAIGWADWVRTWGPAIGCFVAAFIVLRVSSSKANTTGYYPWTDKLNELQLVDSSGPRTVHLMRERLASGNNRDWHIGNGLLIQGDPKDGRYPVFQVQIQLTNNSDHSCYVSAYDFTAIDSEGQKWQFEPWRMLRMPPGVGLSGRWLSPGEAWSGWLVSSRGNHRIDEIVFSPDRMTSIAVAVRAN